MRVTGLKRVLKEDLSKADANLPKWIDALLDPLNTFIDTVGLALQNRLTPADNFYCKEVTMSFTSAVEQELNPRTAFAPNARAYGVSLLASSGETVSTFVWDQKTNGNIVVTVTFLSATDADCTLQIWLR